jgi:hypothetical protein
MNHSIKAILSAVLISLTIILVNCKGDAGDPGPAGAPGTNGADGADGTNGVGFDDAVSRGGVTVYLDGTRPDGVAFKDTLNFAYSSSNLGNSSSYFDAPADSDVETGIQRYLGYNGQNDNSAWTWVGTEVWFNSAPATKKDTSKYIDFEVYAPVTFPKEGKYFQLVIGACYNGCYDDAYFGIDYANDGTAQSYTGNVSDSTFTGYKYDTISGGLQYKSKFTVPDYGNSTGYSLKVTVVTDATVYRTIYNPNDERKSARAKSRAKSSAANSRKSPVKAEMQSMK